MPRKNIKRRQKTRPKRRPGAAVTRYSARRMMRPSFRTSTFGVQHILCLLTASLPILRGTTPAPIKIIGLFDLAFNLLVQAFGGNNYYQGAICSFKITPGCLVFQSPLLAKNSTRYSFPGYPVSIKYINILCKTTVAMGQYIGKWAAVFIPFRELHDDSHYKTLLSMTFAEVAAMPYAKTANTFTDLRFT